MQVADARMGNRTVSPAFPGSHRDTEGPPHIINVLSGISNETVIRGVGFQEIPAFEPSPME